MSVCHVEWGPFIAIQCLSDSSRLLLPVHERDNFSIHEEGQKGKEKSEQQKQSFRLENSKWTQKVLINFHKVWGWWLGLDTARVS